MPWYWIALAAGVIAPWLVLGSTLRIAFAERGVVAGLGTWLGSCVLTVPVMFLLIWLGRLIVR